LDLLPGDRGIMLPDGIAGIALAERLRDPYARAALIELSGKRVPMSFG
jgi:hypothetical protein